MSTEELQPELQQEIPEVAPLLTNFTANFRIEISSLHVEELDVVKKVDWKLIAEEENHKLEKNLSTSLTLDDSKEFISFENLTSETVTSWIEVIEQNRLLSIKSNMQSRLNTMKNQTNLISKAAPWIAVSNEE